MSHLYYGKNLLFHLLFLWRIQNKIEDKMKICHFFRGHVEILLYTSLIEYNLY